MWLHSSPKLSRLLGCSQMCLKLSICGSKFRSSGHHWSPCLWVVILQDKCPFKLNNSLVSIRTGCVSWRRLSRPRRLSPAVKTICWKISSQTCRRNWKSAKKCWRPIWRVRERNSLVSISSVTQPCWRFSHRDLSQHPFRRISRSCLMPSLEWPSIRTPIRRVQMRRSLRQSCRSVEEMKNQ